MLRHMRPVTKLLILGGFLTFLLTLYSLHPSSTRLRQSVSGVFSFRERTPCSPELWSDGQWTRRIPPHSTKANASNVADVLEFHGFEGCASDREYKWHLGADDSELSRYPDVSSWQWTPPSRCNARPFVKEEVVQDLVENGGWFLVGDSVTENHFFSLSCMLYPHVIATPNYTLNPYFDRAWPQNLYLNPKSPLVNKLHPPLGFNISTTPLVTFRRVDLLLTEEQLSELYRTTNPEKAAEENFQLMAGGDQAWEILPSEYLSIFTAPLPEANYGTMVVSTAGHWTVTTLPGLKDDSMRKQGIDNVLNFFGDAMKVWAGLVQGWMTGAEQSPEAHMGGGAYTKGGRRRQVVVRSYLPGHDNCHNLFEPWSWYKQGGPDMSYNWGFIREFNQRFADILATGFPDIHYLGIDMPALLRPDTHAGGDCLHLISGPGVIEGWSQYIYHFTTRELNSWLR